MNKRPCLIIWLYLILNPALGFAAAETVDDGVLVINAVQGVSITENVNALGNVVEPINSNRNAEPKITTLSFKDSSKTASPSPLFIIVTTLLFCVLAFIIVWALKMRLVSSGRLSTSSSRHIKVLDSHGLKAGHSAHLLEVKGQAVLVVLGSNQSNVIVLPESNGDPQAIGSID